MTFQGAGRKALKKQVFITYGCIFSVWGESSLGSIYQSCFQIAIPTFLFPPGSGTSKKLAKRNAAAKMLVRIHNVPLDPREGSEAEMEEDQFSIVSLDVTMKNREKKKTKVSLNVGVFSFKLRSRFTDNPVKMQNICSKKQM